MNKAKLKAYAPAARRDFIQAVTQRANLLGLTAADIAPVQITGDIALINGRPWPAKVAQQRELLVARIKGQGFAAVMEAEAYGWFNRCAALRYMELHGYLDHGYRVLSCQTGVLPEILENAASLDSSSLPGLDRDEVVRLKLAGDKDNELYRLLLTTQCNALAASMGFLFETLGDETELLLPDNLLNTDSVIAKMVASIDETDWDQVEIIGWLYQFYISEKKDEVIGKVVKSEDIPAATQLFTPNWIVKYLTQNSIGRLWLMANPSSNLASQMAYYIAPAAQTPEVDAELNALIQTRMADDGGSLSPESITVLDPACGSGHILVEAYDILKAIYLERGYQPRAIPRLILEKNLFGLDIDDRAAQLAGFALLMKARADDRRLFDEKIVLNVMALQDSHGLDDETLANTVFDAAIALEGGDALHSGQLFGGDQLATQHSSGLKPNDLRELIQVFAHAKTFGSLLTVPVSLADKLDKFDALLQAVQDKGNTLAESYASQLREQFLLPAKSLAKQYDAVIANPPYMSSKGMNSDVKNFGKKEFPDSKVDLFAMFIERGFGWCKHSGFNSMVTMQNWMFLSSYQSMREKLLSSKSIFSLIQIGYNSFPEINSKVAQACAFSMMASQINNFIGRYINLNLASQSADKNIVFLERTVNLTHDVQQSNFKKIPGSPVAYWVGHKVHNAFECMPSFREEANPRVGMQTSNNDRYLRFWWEVRVDEQKNSLDSDAPKWIVYLKGGAFRRWYGNLEYLLRYNGDSKFILEQPNATVLPLSRLKEPKCTWTDLTSGEFNCRIAPTASFHDLSGHCFYPSKEDQYFLLGISNSKPFAFLLSLINSTLHFQVGDVGKIPVPKIDKDQISLNVLKLVTLSKTDWDDQELSWDFSSPSWINGCFRSIDLKSSWSSIFYGRSFAIESTKALEEENNRIFIDAYSLQSELSPIVPEEQINLARADREKDSQRLISYAIGCMMGRYSLDEPGLIYAHAGNAGFDATRYTKFPADADGIVPVTDEFWFDDDAANRIREFLGVVWGAETLDENMNWLADSLGRKAGQNAEEAIRSYIAGSFFKDHLKTYKKRPIYWLFSSGKQKAFECLVYLHRYNEGTLARMRNEYVIPLAGKFGGRADLLQNQIDAASTTSERTKRQKELDTLKKKQLELNQFDEQLRHYADQRISIDLDDGVKVNYGKFGNLLAEVKAITGGAGDE
ncbi:SAM-dependent methyltransferase [Undibacterium sp. GrIS 1.2]|uniref:BREX-1 system adenine-specific DNA-methyltransferase PglX n=1 Tax=Undibacterium sp. GrIS 1.2 TaxID=3143933 RepID=UPI0033957602